MPSVSVIVPNYNHARYLPRRIDSILAQTRGAFELLILDDCSPDNSREVIGRYSTDPRVRVIVNERNSGNSYLQWRKGIELTNGDYIWIAESDDFADSRFLERLGGKLDEDERVGLAFCETIVVDEDGTQTGWYANQLREYGIYNDGHCEILDREFVMDGRDYILTFMFPWNTVPNVSGALLRRSALESIGGPVTSMRLCGDWLTYCKILLEWKVGHVPDRLNYFRQHTVNVRSNTRGDTLAREWLEVANWAEGELGRFPRKTRRQLDRFAAHALLGLERGESDTHVALGRMPSALTRAWSVAPKLLPATVLTLLRQSASKLMPRRFRRNSR